MPPDKIINGSVPRLSIQEVSEASSKQLLTLLAAHPLINKLLSANAGIWERSGNVTIAEHELAVLEVFDKYKFERILPDDTQQILTLPHFKLILALHDVGKHLPENYQGDMPAGKDKDAQHLRTLYVLDEVRPLLPFSDKQHAIAKAIISNDTLGSCVRTAFNNEMPPIFPENRQSKHVDASGIPLLSRLEVETNFRNGGVSFNEYKRIVDSWLSYISANKVSGQKLSQLATEAVESIRAPAATLQTDSKTLLHYQLLYFQCDTRAYTADASGNTLPFKSTPSLDYLYRINPQATAFGQCLLVFNQESCRFVFSEPVEEVFSRIIEMI